MSWQCRCSTRTLPPLPMACTCLARSRRRRRTRSGWPRYWHVVRSSDNVVASTTSQLCYDVFFNTFIEWLDSPRRHAFRRHLPYVIGSLKLEKYLVVIWLKWLWNGGPQKITSDYHPVMIVSCMQLNRSLHLLLVREICWYRSWLTGQACTRADAVPLLVRLSCTSIARSAKLYNNINRCDESKASSRIVWSS